MFIYIMFEPHLNGFDHSPNGESSLLEELDKIAPIHSFDAFPKVGQVLQPSLMYPDTVYLH